MKPSHEVINGDCIQKLKDIESNSIDLILTSPPYANQRKEQYGGISSENYVKWFMSISKQLFRTLKSTGTFILNIKENIVDCEVLTYVYELVLALKKSGWLWTEEFI